MAGRLAGASVAATIGAAFLVLVAGAQSATSQPARIAYSANGQIWTVSPDGSQPRLLARGEQPSWSPDGRQIAFQSARVPGNGSDIYVMDADGSDQARLVMHPGGGGQIPDNTADESSPAWSPTSWIIAFVTRRDGNEEIYSMDPIGHSVQRLTNTPAADRDPAWSPDGNAIAFSSDREGNDEIYTLSLRQNLARVTNHAAADRAPAWSPDGRRIAFQSFRDGNWEIYSMSADGSDVRRLTETAAADTSPTWSRDGQSIVFTRSEDSGRSYLARITPTGEVAQPITGSDRSADYPDVRPVADVALGVTHPQSVRRGRPVAVRLVVTNAIRAPAYDVVVTASVPAGVRFVRARVGRGRCSSRARRISCSIPFIGPSASISVRAALRARRCGRVSFIGAVSTAQADINAVDNRRRTSVRVSC